MVDSGDMGIGTDVSVRLRNRMLVEAVRQLARAQATVNNVQHELADGGARLQAVADELQEVRTTLETLRKSSARAGWIFLVLGVILGIPAGLLVSYLSHRLGL
jgi:hypothetical protein